VHARRKEGPGSVWWRGRGRGRRRRRRRRLLLLLAGLPSRRSAELCVISRNVRKRSTKERKRESARENAVDGGGGGEGAGAGAGAGSFLAKIATPRRASRHCRLARNTWGRKVRGKARGWRERGEIERGRGRKDVRQGAYEGARRTEAASRRVLPRRARSDAARLSRRGKREGGGGGRGCHGGGGKDAHSFLESRGPLLIPKLFPFVARDIRTALDQRRLGLRGMPRGWVRLIDDARSARYLV